MDAAEIRVILTRSTELHTRISDAIQRCLKNEFYFGRSQNNSHGFKSHLHRANGGSFNDSPSGFDSHFQFTPGEGITDAKRLSTIRDALEILEEQLELLQTLNAYRGEERNSVLTRLERCRNLLLTELLEYKGKESEVIQELFHFLGVSVEESGSAGCSQDKNEDEESDLTNYHQPLLSGKRFKDDSFPSFQDSKNPSSISSDSCDSDRLFPSESSSEEGTGDRDASSALREEKDEAIAPEIDYSNPSKCPLRFTPGPPLHPESALPFLHEPIDEDCLISNSSLSSPYLYRSDVDEEDSEPLFSSEEENELCSFCLERSAVDSTRDMKHTSQDPSSLHPSEILPSASPASAAPSCDLPPNPPPSPRLSRSIPRHAGKRSPRNPSSDLYRMAREVGGFVFGTMVDAFKLSMKVAVVTVGVSLGMMFVNVLRGKIQQPKVLTHTTTPDRNGAQRRRFVPKPSVSVALPPSTPLSPFYYLRTRDRNDVRNAHSSWESAGNRVRPRDIGRHPSNHPSHHTYFQGR